MLWARIGERALWMPEQAAMERYERIPASQVNEIPQSVPRENAADLARALT